ncbi:MAG TPA: 3-dehydroquinate synthase family protein, partial [Saprospiraceae bacterium]|nr:3-dehydroquinate synthase family protein [Saprospiraceae bacterium]
MEDRLDSMTDLLHDIGYSNLFILADSNTHQHCVPLLPSPLLTHQAIIIPAGESNKNLEQCQVIWDKLLQHGADRKSILVNVGGGMICDLGGFAASCFQRGIRFVHLPTSLLAMTDAAIGGKTGVDFKGYKNFIGSFRNPEFILIHRPFLNTLPEAEWMSGLAEIIKHAIIGSTYLWNLIDEAQNENDADWEAIIKESVEVKMKVVEADPEEQGERKILNFGHTVGHALESYYLTKGSPISHGQAIT